VDKVIIEKAQDTNIIIMGTDGRIRLERLFLGSVTLKVIIYLVKTKRRYTAFSENRFKCSYSKHDNINKCKA
jgi:hypothetical protein